ncbi:MAG TPA: DUF1707 domain-containing protein, partial [Acidimicrobiales bacterium]|nr:DUF1707 domain-containing protein [Acidimicrobiales bacterium]
MDDPPGTRIGDAERQEFIDALRQATAEGRLTLDEFSERSGEVYAARTRAELDRQVADLPASSRPASRSPGTAARPPTLRPSDAGSGGAGVAPPGRGGGSARRRFVAIMGASRPRGRWRAAEEISAFAFWGGVVLDLREALIETSVVEITAWAVMGSVDVVVPDGIPVELDGFVLMGGSHDATRGPVIEGAPLVRVKARGMWGGVTVRTGKSAQQKADERALRSDERADRLQRRAEEVADRAQRRAEEALERVRDRHGVPPLHHLHGLPAPRLDDLLPPIFGRRADQVPSERSVSEPAQRWSPADDTPASGSSATGTPTGATGTGTGAGAAAPAAGPAAGGPGATAGPAASDAHDPQADTPAMGTPMTTAPAAGSGRRPDAARTAEAPVADGTPTAGPAPGAGATPGAGSSGPGGDSSPASRRPGPGEESIASSGGSGPGGDSTPS